MNQTLNALDISTEHVGRFVEFTTVATDEHAAAGLGALGDTITVEGWLLAVVNGDTAGTRWRMRVAVHDQYLRKTEITSTLGANRDVTLRPN